MIIFTVTHSPLPIGRAQDKFDRGGKHEGELRKARNDCCVYVTVLVGAPAVAVGRPPVFNLPAAARLLGRLQVERVYA